MLSEKKLIQIIREELEADSKKIPTGDIDAANGPESVKDIEAREGVWAGGDNLVLDVDQPKASGAESNTKGQEIMKITESLNRDVYELENAQKRGMPPQAFTLLELYKLQDKFKK